MGSRKKEIKSVAFTNVTKWFKVRESSLGTRGKYWLHNPEDEEEKFLMKLSKENFPFEFWSEVIASKYGQMLGIKTTNYDVAYSCDEKPMIGSFCSFEYNKEINFFYHGTFILNSYCKDFEAKSLNAKIIGNDNQLLSHSFQNIKEVLSRIGKDRLLDQFLKMFIFDALIGNTDRHTDNWAILCENSDEKKKSIFVERIIDKEFDDEMLLKIIMLLGHYMVPLDHGGILTKEDLFSLITPSNNIPPKMGKWSMCNLYDSSSSLGWNLSEENIKNRLKQKNGIDEFIIKGKQETLWGDKKLSHFDFLSKVHEKHTIRMNKIIHDIIKRFETIQVEAMVNSIDIGLPEEFEQFKLSSGRKEFIKKQLIERMERLKNLVLWNQ